MNVFQAIVLSVVEGLTEFLPVSSTGHLILASNLLQISQTNFVKSFEIAIQLGAILAVVGLYWQRLITDKKLWPKLLVGFLPSAVLGFIAYPFIKQNLIGNFPVVLRSLFLGGLVLLFIDKVVFGEKVNLNSLSLPKALVIGLFQSVSIIPGVSRAAATIVGGLVMSLDKKSAVEFSFLLAVPTMAAATGLDLVKSGWSFSSREWLLLCIGFTGALLTAWLAVKFLLSFVKSHTFFWFGVYRTLLAGLWWIAPVFILAAA